jgi:type II secretory pathway pseudopilin PulG
MVGGYFRDMSNTTLIILIVVAIVVIVAIAIVGYQMARRKRTERLQEQYGPEYNRALDQADSQREAESELRDRSKRHEKLELRSLDSSEREDFERRWSDVQGQFVDDPKNAVHNADVLVLEVMSARGYPVEDFDQRADDLSVSHPEITQRYREASRIAQANEDGAVDTEDLRQAVTSYRALVLALLADDGDRTRQDDVDRGQQDDRDRSRQDDVDRTRHDDVDRTRQNDTQSEHDNNQMTERETKA